MDKVKLQKDIDDMRAKLASMEEELNKPEVFKHFPSKGYVYYQYSPGGIIYCLEAPDDKIRPNTYKTREEAQEAYNKAVAIEKIKRRVLELQGNWKPDWTDKNEEKYCIQYSHFERKFIPNRWLKLQQYTSLPCMKNEDITELIISELEDELKLIFDIS